MKQADSADPAIKKEISFGVNDTKEKGTAFPEIPSFHLPVFVLSKNLIFPLHRLSPRQSRH